MKHLNQAQKNYTLDDHSSRETDQYALTKYEITLHWLKNSLGPINQRELSLYNIGCGAGEFNRRAALNGFNVTGFEPDSETFKMSVSNNTSTPLIQLRNLGIFEIESEKKADIIVMHDVLEHIDDDRAAAQKVAALLCRGGRLIISVPALPFLFGYHDELLMHYRRYTISSLLNILNPYFIIHKKRYFGFFFIPLVYWYSVINRKPYPDQAKTGKGLGAFIIKLICLIETNIPLPLGTSIIMELEPK